MSVINFSVTKPLEKKIGQAVREFGFNSKAELFRFAVMNFIYHLERQASEQNEFEYLTSRLAEVTHEKLSKKKIPPARTQLEKLLNASI